MASKHSSDLNCYERAKRLFNSIPRTYIFLGSPKTIVGQNLSVDQYISDVPCQFEGITKDRALEILESKDGNTGLAVKYFMDTVYRINKHDIPILRGFVPNCITKATSKQALRLHGGDVLKSAHFLNRLITECVTVVGREDLSFTKESSVNDLLVDKDSVNHDVKLVLDQIPECTTENECIEALEKSNGDVVDAIVFLNRQMGLPPLEDSDD